MMRFLPVAILMLFARPAAANSYLVEPDLATAQARSNQECQQHHSCGQAGQATQYWWAMVANTGSGQVAIVIEPAPQANGQDFSGTDLTSAEQAALVDEATATAQGFKTPTWRAQQGAPAQAPAVK